MYTPEPSGFSFSAPACAAPPPEPPPPPPPQPALPSAAASASASAGKDLPTPLLVFSSGSASIGELVMVPPCGKHGHGSTSEGAPLHPVDGCPSPEVRSRAPEGVERCPGAVRAWFALTA